MHPSCQQTELRSCEGALSNVGRKTSAAKANNSNSLMKRDRGMILGYYERRKASSGSSQGLTRRLTKVLQVQVCY
jgi:hypothetical protein